MYFYDLLVFDKIFMMTSSNHRPMEWWNWKLSIGDLHFSRAATYNCSDTRSPEKCPYFADNILKCAFMIEELRILIQISLKYLKRFQLTNSMSVCGYKVQPVLSSVIYNPVKSSKYRLQKWQYMHKNMYQYVEIQEQRTSMIRHYWGYMLWIMPAETFVSKPYSNVTRGPWLQLTDDLTVWSTVYY